MEGVDFSNAIITNGKLQGSQLTKANFDGVNLSTIYLTNTDLRGVINFDWRSAVRVQESKITPEQYNSLPWNEEKKKSFHFKILSHNEEPSQYYKVKGTIAVDGSHIGLTVYDQPKGKPVGILYDGTIVYEIDPENVQLKSGFWWKKIVPVDANQQHQEKHPIEIHTEGWVKAEYLCREEKIFLNNSNN